MHIHFAVSKLLLEATLSAFMQPAAVIELSNAMVGAVQGSDVTNRPSQY